MPEFAPDTTTPLNDEELAALEYFLDSSLTRGMPSMVRRLLHEVRERRAAERRTPSGDGWPLVLEDPMPAEATP